MPERLLFWWRVRAYAVWRRLFFKLEVTMNLFLLRRCLPLGSVVVYGCHLELLHFFEDGEEPVNFCCCVVDVEAGSGAGGEFEDLL